MQDSKIVVKNLSKFYKKKKVLNSVSFDVPQGEVFGLLGSNGAGKTTIVKILTGQLLPDEGKVYVGGYDVVKEPVNVKQSIGVALENERSMYWRLSGEENLIRFGILYYLSKKEVRARARKYLKMFGLYGDKDKWVGHYSSGMRIKLSLIRALIPNPSIIFLDEPWSKLDPGAKVEVKEMLKELAKIEYKTIFLCSHDLKLVEDICDKVAIIDKGEILCRGNPKGLTSQIPGEEIVRFEVKKIERLKAILPEESFRVSNGEVHMPVDKLEKNLPLLFSHLGKEVENIFIDKKSLEDVYFYYTKKKIKGGIRK